MLACCFSNKRKKSRKSRQAEAADGEEFRRGSVRGGEQRRSF